MIDNEYLAEVVESFEGMIKECADKLGIDNSYYKFKLSCEVFNENSKIRELDLYEEEQDGFCIFCGTKTYYYDREKDMHLCAKCYNKLNKGKVKR